VHTELKEFFTGDPTNAIITSSRLRFVLYHRAFLDCLRPDGTVLEIPIGVAGAQLNLFNLLSFMAHYWYEIGIKRRNLLWKEYLQILRGIQAGTIAISTRKPTNKVRGFTIELGKWAKVYPELQ
jgi:hypothetical protein